MFFLPNPCTSFLFTPSLWFFLLVPSFFFLSYFVSPLLSVFLLLLRPSSPPFSLPHPFFSLSRLPFSSVVLLFFAPILALRMVVITIAIAIAARAVLVALIYKWRHCQISIEDCVGQMKMQCNAILVYRGRVHTRSLPLSPGDGLGCDGMVEELICPSFVQ